MSVNAIDLTFAKNLGCKINSLKHPLLIEFGNGTRMVCKQCVTVWVRFGGRISQR